MERPPLSKAQRTIAVLHVLLAVAFVIVGLLDTSGGDGWSDLARLAVGLIAGIYLLATATVMAVARYVMSNNPARIALLVLGPPVLMVIAVFLVRGA
jgi:predicted transporter